jgi:GT2 family glycosyltransferase
MPADEWLVQSWKNAQPMMQCGLWLIPKKTIEIAGLWDERLSLINDFDFFTRVLVNSKKVLFADDATLYYRSGINGSLSGTKSRKGFESAFMAIEKATATLLAKRNDKEAQLSCANIWQSFIYIIYPHHTDLVSKAQEYLTKLPAPTLPFPCGGYTKLLKHVVGWKATKSIKSFLKYE